jgi:hypothetical protein
MVMRWDLGTVSITPPWKMTSEPNVQGAIISSNLIFGYETVTTYSKVIAFYADPNDHRM